MKRGFTLIELMVSVAIFSVVMTVALGALLAISSAERKAETFKTVMDNLNFAMEGMSRTIRTGVNYGCGIDTATPTDCTSGDTKITFNAADGTTVTYCWGLNNSCVSSGGTSLLRKIGSGSFVPITAPEITVSTFTLYVKGAPAGLVANGGDSTQPKVTLTLGGSVSANGTNSTTFALQTTITQRIYDQ